MLNAVAEQDLGRSGVELLGLSFNEVFPRDTNKQLFQRYRDVLLSGKADRFEHQYTLSGQVQPNWFDVSAVPLEDMVVVSYNNISQLKAEADSKKLTETLTQAFNASLSGITVFEPIYGANGQIDDFRFVMINEVGLRMSGGFTREELIGQTIWQIYPATSINGLFDKYVQVCRTGQSLSGEKYYPEYDIWREYTILRVNIGIMVTYNDITMYMKQEEAAQQSSLLLDDILMGVPVGLAIFKAVRSLNQHITDLQILHANNFFRKVFGTVTNGQSSELLSELLKGDTNLGLLNRCIASVEARLPHAFEMPFKSQGQTHWYQASLTPKKDQLILTLTDITQSKLTQQAIHSQAELLQSISNNTPAGLVLWDAVRDSNQQIIDFRYRMTNRMNNYLTGFTEEYLVGEDLLTLFPRFRGTELETTLKQTIETGRTQHMILTYYTERSDGWFDAQFNRVGDGVLMTYMDVSEQHKAQLAQKEQADLLQLVIDAQPSGLVLYKAVREKLANGQPGSIIDFTIELVNSVKLNTSKRTMSQLIGKRMLKLFPDEEGHAFFDLVAEVATTGVTKEWVLPNIVEGVNSWFKSSLIRHGDLVLFTFLDVSELKHQHKALEMANTELRRSNENLQQFAYVASHDLQEPLRKIQSFGDLLANNYAVLLDENGRDMIRRMQLAAQRMSNLIADLLSYSRVSTQRSPFELVSLTRLMSSVIDDLDIAVHESGVVCEFSNLPTVMGDRTQLNQLFRNLLFNAILYRRPNVPPVVKISARKVAAADLPESILKTELSLTTDQSANIPFFYEISITDNGIGFDEKYLDRIFQVFQRLHSKTAYPGTGVGLAICRKVIENHRGAITATSKPGEGATFSVYLPV
ncbi:PAS domain-containing protein [Fibrella sp. HMF5405]|uniref:histidine kinase n=2 Tax=Fibrella forsythiae TaxID=2817061 RepID=A0ABS3JRZ9_9BACT|nr:PAS domain-containing protein [Fibrella forsythiae]